MSNSTFRVLVREVHVAHKIVKATSKEEAVQKVINGEGELDFVEYSHTLSEDTWTVEKE